METEFALSLGTERWALPADRDTITIGRASNADIRLQADDQISRIHARLARSGATWTLIDESRNGTALNGRRISAPTPLTDADRIHIGRSVLTFHEPAPTAGSPATHAPASAPVAPPAAPSPQPEAFAAPSASPAAANLPHPQPPSTLPPVPEAGPAANPTAQPEAFGAPHSPDTHAAAQPGAEGNRPHPEPGAPGTPPPFAQPPAPGAGPSASPEPLDAGPARPEPLDAGPAHPEPADAWPAHPERAVAESASSGRAGEGNRTELAAADRPDSGMAPAQSPFAAGSNSADPAVNSPSQPQPNAEPQPPTAWQESAPAPGLRASGPFAAGSRSSEAAASPTSESHPRAETAPRAETQPATDWRDSSPAPGRPASEDSPFAAAGPEGAYASPAGASFAGAGAESAYAAGGPTTGSEGVEEALGEEFGWADGDDAGRVGSGGGEAWAAYPSADNPEPARSPWAAAINPPPRSDRTVVGSTGSSSSGWPGVGDRPAPEPAPQASARRVPAAERRLPEGPAEPLGTVRLSRVLTIAGAVLGLGLLINLAGSLLASGPGGALRWLVAPTSALVVAMVLALMDATGPRQSGRKTPLDVPVVTAIIVVLVGVGIGGFALTGGTKYAAGYITGKETGADHLIKPVAKTDADVTVIVENVTYTSHFTRVDVAVKNDSRQSVALPLDGSVAFTGSDGNSLKADGFRSQWTNNVPAGATKQGTITFKGHLPDGINAAALTLKAGSTTIAVNSIPLSN